MCAIYVGDEPRMPWEAYAQDAVETIVKKADFDEILGTVTLLAHDDDDLRSGKTFSSLEDVEDHLVEVYSGQWYSYVPFEGGEAVFEDDARGVIDDLMTVYPAIQILFGQGAAPADSETIVTANELLQGAESSRIVRVSLEEISEELVRYLAANPDKMREMSPRKFEELIAAIFRNEGYKVTLTPIRSDGGLDIVAIQRSDIGTTLTIVECKRYAPERKVGVGVVRGLYGVVEQRRATKGVVATTSFFTRVAETFRKSVEYRLALADFDALTRRVQEWRRRMG